MNVSKVKQDLVSALNVASDDVRQFFSGLSDERLNRKPDENSWSVAQCLEHLIISNELYFSKFDRVIDGSYQNTFLEKFSPLSGMWGALLIKALKSDSQKAKTIAEAKPSDDLYRQIVERFIAHQRILIGYIDALDETDWKKVKFTSPFLSIATYDLHNTFRIIVEHERRHIRQAKRALDATESA